MANSFTGRKRVRKSFGRIAAAVDMPNLIEVQKSSYDQFLQRSTPPEQRSDTGLQEVFKSVFPIRDFSSRGTLEFVKYEFEEPKYDVEECQQRGMTYAVPLKVTLRLVVWDIDEETGARSIRDIKEQDVYIGDMPLMTNNGTFVINGTERVIVSQMHRSPGVFFDHDKGKTHSSGKFLFAARVIPYRGSWLDFEFDAKDLVFVRIDRRRKLPVTTLLMALDSARTEALRGEQAAAGKSLEPSEVVGMSPEEILDHFYDKVTFHRIDGAWKTEFRPDRMRGVKLAHDLVDATTGERLAEAGTKLTPKLLRHLAAQGLREQLVPDEDLAGRYVGEDLINEQTGEIYVEAGEEITEATVAALKKADIKEVKTLAIDHINVGPYIRNTLAVDRNASREEALFDIYRVMRPGEPPTLESAEALFKGLFFDPERYDLSAVGRVKMNSRLGFETDDSVRMLRKEDKPLAFMNASAITAIRTAAVSAVATRLLARYDASVLAVLGSGVQAKSHLEAIPLVRPIREIRLFSPSGRTLPSEPAATACSSAEEAVRGADIVCTVTSSREPVLRLEWLKPGAHINAVGSSIASTRELDAETMAACALFVDRRESTINESGDFLMAVREGLIDQEHIRAELGELLLGQAEGRKSESELTLFKSLGLAIEDLACAVFLYEKARDGGRGASVEF